MSGPYAQPWAPRHPVQGLQCLRCHVLQPPLPPGHYTCVACGAVLPLQRWVAHPPPGGPARRPGRNSRATWDSGNGRYAGPPSYRGAPPRWGFPPAVWQGPVPEPGPPNPARSLRAAAIAVAVTAAAALLAAGAETWRFLLMLDGRTQVLSGGAVRASDVLVAAAGLAVVVAALTAVVLTVPALTRASRFAAVRAGRTPPRSTRAILLRLLVPGWNVYGAGQVAAEADVLLESGAGDPTKRTERPGALVLWWWASWVVNAAVLAATLLRGWGDSLQAIADTVELHIALDLTAALTAILLAAVLLRFARLAIARPPTMGRWVIRAPAPTRASTPAGAGSHAATTVAGRTPKPRADLEQRRPPEPRPRRPE